MALNKTGNFTQDCITAENGLKCGNCTKIDGYTVVPNYATLAQVNWVVNCKECAKDFALNTQPINVTMTTLDANKTAAAKADLGIFCYKEPDPEYSNPTTALIMVLVLGIVSFVIMVALIIFFFTRRPKPQPQDGQEALDGNSSGVDNGRKDDEATRPLGMAPMPMTAGKPATFGEESQERTPDNQHGDEPFFSKTKGLKKKTGKGGVEM